MNDLERMARALGDVYETHGQSGQLRARRPSQSMLLAQAKALLLELRNPSEGMREAAIAHDRAMGRYDEGGISYGQEADDMMLAAETFEAMIDSILSQEKV